MNCCILLFICGAVGTLDFSVNFPADSIELEANPVVSFTPSIYRSASAVTFQFTVTNSGSQATTFALRNTVFQTPLGENFFAHHPDIFYLGRVLDIVGDYFPDDLVIPLESGEIYRSDVEFEAGSIAFVNKSPIGVNFRFPLTIVENQALTEIQIITTNTVDVTFILGEKQMVPGEAPVSAEPRLLRRRTQEVTRHESGIWHYDYQCVDDPSAHGIVFSNGTPVPCNNLATSCTTSSSVSGACPVTCGTCTESTAQWKFPSQPRDIRFASGSDKVSCQTSYTLGGVTQTEREWILQAEQVKEGYCATNLWHIDDAGATFDSNFNQWFGDQTSEKYTQLRDGYAKICTSNNYKYNCNPDEGNPSEDSCTISFRLNGQQYNNMLQQDVVNQGLKQDFIDECATGCSYSATIAWVWSGRTGDREINLCPIGFWIQDDALDGGMDSKTGVIVHELSHFVDIADTNDITYSVTTMQAPENVNLMLDNAASWDNFGEDDDWEKKTWADFANAPDATPEPTSSTVTSEPTTSEPTTAEPTQGNNTPEPTPVVISSSFFTMTGNCQVQNDCVSTPNYPNDHGNNEKCTITSTMDADLNLGNVFEIETCCDDLSVAGTDVNAASQMPNSIQAGQTIEWESDGSVTNSGWQLCFSNEVTTAQPQSTTITAAAPTSGSGSDQTETNGLADEAATEGFNGDWTWAIIVISGLLACSCATFAAFLHFWEPQDKYAVPDHTRVVASNELITV